MSIMENKKLIKKAKYKVKRLQKLRQDPRYLKTLGKLKRAGFLDVRDVPEYCGQVFLQDALWAAELEPRVYELLPAILVRRPKFFAFLKLPDELANIVREIRAGHPKTPYQGIMPEKYYRWVSFVGRKPANQNIMKSFRLSQVDLEILGQLSKETSQSQTQILRQALKEYASRL